MNANTIQLHTASNIANAIMFNALANATTLGIHWPSDAVYCVVEVRHTGSMGWGQNINVTFASNDEELKALILASADFNLQLRNDFARRVYSWDWGPEEMLELAHNAHQVPANKAEQNTNQFINKRVSIAPHLEEFQKTMRATVERLQRASWPQHVKADEWLRLQTVDRANDDLQTVIAKLRG